MTKTVWFLFLTAIILSGLSGYLIRIPEIEWYSYPVPEVHIIETQKIIETRVEVPVIVEKQVEVEKIVYQPYPVREFKSLEEFTKWAKHHLISMLPILGYENKADCDDYAEHLQREAAKEGYLVSSVLILDGRCAGKYVIDLPNYHMGNMVMIDNNIYYVEPQPTGFRIVWLCYRD